MEKFTELKNLVDEISVDADKFYNKGNKAAGTRIRTGMQELKRLAQFIRNDVTELKNKTSTDQE